VRDLIQEGIEPNPGPVLFEAFKRRAIHDIGPSLTEEALNNLSQQVKASGVEEPLEVEDAIKFLEDPSHKQIVSALFSQKMLYHILQIAHAVVYENKPGISLAKHVNLCKHPDM
jgi:hypothetical protein